MAEARRVRLWLVAATLFAAGLGGRLVMDATADTAYAYPTAIVLQCWFYGAGLLVWSVGWLRSADVGRQSMLGCVGWLVVAALCGLAILSSSPH